MADASDGGTGALAGAANIGATPSAVVETVAAVVEKRLRRLRRRLLPLQPHNSWPPRCWSDVDGALRDGADAADGAVGGAGRGDCHRSFPNQPLRRTH